MNGTAANAESDANETGGHRPSQGADISYVLLCQFGHWLFFTFKQGAVGNHIIRIFFSSFPRQMPFRHASFVSFATGMCGLMIFSWRSAVHSFANQAMNIKAAHVSVSSGKSCERPCEAFITLVRKHYFIVELLWCACWGSTCQRVSMPSLSEAMSVAQTFPIDRFVASTHRACSKLFSHSDLLERLAWLGRVVGLEPDGAPVYFTLISER